ncbi:MAG: ABC transporter ATP-binding protein [Desertimonas sp.]
MTSPALSARGVHVDIALGRSTVEAVRGATLEVGIGRRLALVGSSGSGKTMLARAVAGALPRTARLRGEIDVAGIDVRARRPAGLVTMAFQEAAASFNPTRTIGWHLRESCRAAAIDAATAIPSALDAAGLDRTHEGAYAFELSGGQVQRAGLALAIVTSPKLLIADEVTTALDGETAAEVLDRLGELTRSGAMAVVFVTHDLGRAQRWGDDIAVMGDGRIVEHGEVCRVSSARAHPTTRALMDSRLPDVTIDELRDDTGAERPGTEGDPVLEARRVTRRFAAKHGRRVDALGGVDVAVHAGERLALVGRSGSGKTTLLRLLAAVEAADSGVVAWNGHDVTALGRRRLRARRWRVQMVFQNPLAAFDPRHDVGTIVSAPIRSFPERCPVPVDDRVEELLTAVGLDPGLTRRRPDQLSGGQRQRVAIARALSVEPDVLLCDEPVSSLDAGLRRSVVELIARLCRERNMALVFVTHDLAPLPLLCERALVLDGGRVVDRFNVRGPADVSEPVPDGWYRN